MGAELVGGDRGRRPVTHGSQRFAQETVARTRVSPVLSMKSISRPCLSTARNRYFHFPLIFPYVSFTRQDVARWP